MITASPWKILLIDDDEDDQLLIGRMLKSIQRRKVRVEAVSSYSAGIQAIQGGNFDAILVDYDLGRMNGVELIREAVTLGCKAPLIMVTGRGRYEVDLDAMQAGASEYLAKSDLNATLLERAIRYAIERKQTEDDLRQAKEQLEHRVDQRTRELQEREDLLSRVLDILPVGVWITDDQGVINRGNQAGQKIWAGARYVGIEQYAEYKGWWLSTGQLIQPDEWAAAKAITRGETNLDEEIEIQCFDGTHKLILNSAIPIRNDEGQVIGSIIINQDITGRKQAESELRKANGLLEKMFNNLHLGIAFLDRDFNFIRVNPMYAAYDGRDESFFPGKNHFALYPNAENETIFRSVLDTGQPYITFAKPFTYKDHPERQVTYWDWSLQPVYEPDGAISGLVISLLNVTEHIHVQDTLHITHELERHAQLQATRLHTVIDAMLNPVMVYDAAGKMIQVNPATVELFGFDPSGETNRRLIQEVQARYFDGTPITYENLPSTRVLRGETVNGEMAYFTNIHGQEYILKINAAPLYLNGSLFGAVILWHNLSEQKRFEKALEESHASMAEVLESISDGFFTLDNRLAVTYMNKAAGQMLHCDPLGVTGKPLFDTFWQARGSVFEEKYRLALQEKKAQEFEVYFKPSPYEGWYNVRVYPFSDGIAIYFQITTERKQAEMALQSVAQFPGENPYPVMRISRDTTIQYINQSGTDLLTELGFVTGEKAPAAVGKRVLEALESGQRSQMEVTTRGRTYSLHLVPFPASGYVNLYGQDISEIKQAEQELNVHIQQLETLNAQLESLNKELKDFVFAASHDLQEPLRKIRVFGQMLREKSSQIDDEETCDYIERMIQATERMQRMIEDLLDLSRVTTEGGSFVPVDLSAIVSDVLQDLEVSLQEARGQVQVEALPVVDADPVQMRQLIQNLIANALKFRKPGTPPLVKLGVRHRSEESVTLYIEDNGIGFDMQFAERIFQPFMRLHPRSQYAGSGIGLAVCRRIIERHGGEITATSSPGQGATFLITLPPKIPNQPH